MNILFLGLPGAGKGTHARKISKDYDFIYLASGDIFRNAVQEGSPLGEKAKKYIHKGKLVPDEVAVEIISIKLNKYNYNNVVFDGFPRTMGQAEALTEILSKEDKKINLCIYLHVEEKELIKRLSGRVICENCGAIFNTEFDLPEKEGICDKCGDSLFQRKDDKKEIVKKRIKENKFRTQKLINYYSEKEVLEEVTGTNKTPAEVHQGVEKVVKKYLEPKKVYKGEK